MDPTAADQPRRKTSRGRQKIEIKKVEKENSRYVTFSKRKNGIFKKAAEISALTGAEIAVILFSEHGKVFTYGEPDPEKLINRYLSSETSVVSEVDETEISADSEPGNKFSRIREAQEREYSRAVEAIERLKKSLQMAEKNRSSGFWWENSVDDSMEEGELEGYKESLEELKRNVMNRIEAVSGTSFVDNQSEGCLI